jgi:hypothetical protein
MAVSMKRWHRIGESITRLFDHHSEETGYAGEVQAG